MKKRTVLLILGLALLLVGLTVGVLIGLADEQPMPETPAAQPAESAAPAAVPTSEAFAEGYFRAVGSFHPGTAGSSLRRAHAAYEAYRFAVENRIAETDIPLLRSTMLSAWESLSEDERAWFDENFIGLIGLLDACREDWAANRPLFEDAGVAAEMEALLNDPETWQHWDTLLANTLTLGNSEG